MSITFPVFNGVLDGKNSGEIKEKVKEDFPILMMAELAFWPLFNFFVFKKVPVSLQTSAVFMGTSVWAFILSGIETRKGEEVNGANLFSKSGFLVDKLGPKGVY